MSCRRTESAGCQDARDALRRGNIQLDRFWPMIEGILREISFGKSRICRDVLDDLLGWFGIPEPSMPMCATLKTVPCSDLRCMTRSSDSFP